MKTTPFLIKKQKHNELTSSIITILSLLLVLALCGGVSSTSSSSSSSPPTAIISGMDAATLRSLGVSEEDIKAQADDDNEEDLNSVAKDDEWWRDPLASFSDDDEEEEKKAVAKKEKKKQSAKVNKTNATSSLSMPSLPSMITTPSSRLASRRRLTPSSSAVTMTTLVTGAAVAKTLLSLVLSSSQQRSAAKKGKNSKNSKKGGTRQRRGTPIIKQVKNTISQWMMNLSPFSNRDHANNIKELESLVESMNQTLRAQISANTNSENERDELVKQVKSLHSQIRLLKTQRDEAGALLEEERELYKNELSKLDNSLDGILAREREIMRGEWEQFKEKVLEEVMMTGGEEGDDEGITNEEL